MDAYSVLKLAAVLTMVGLIVLLIIWLSRRGG